MKQETVTINNRAGIHARPSALIVKTANEYDSEIFLELDDMKINAKSIMGIITLGANYKSIIQIIAEGNDEEKAVMALVKLFENRFEEE
ncbi:MAG: HPr family phosphocarrier protein [Spirochaetia bacterium]|jgi:phosphocarrier protein HPr|nr:HPr family phosphocarrier protein [Spirochaetia bacterium]